MLASLPGGPGAFAAPGLTLLPLLLPVADCEAFVAAVEAASNEAETETTAAGDPAEGVNTPGGTADTEELPLALLLLPLLALEMRRMQA